MADLIFGNNTVLPSPASDTGRIDGQILCGFFQMGPTSGTGNNIVAYINGTLPDEVYVEVARACLYDSEGVKVPNGETDEVSLGITPSWVTFPFSTPPNLVADRWYYIAVWADSGEAADFTYNLAGGIGVYGTSRSYAATFPSPVSFARAVGPEDANPCIYCEYTTAAPTTPLETYASGYLTRYQKRQLVGYHRNSGDLRSIEVNASGQLLADVEVEFSSGLFIDGISGQWVEAHILSGEVSVESGAQVITQPGIQVSGAVVVSGTVSANVSGNWVEAHILSGLVAVLSGEVIAKTSGEGFPCAAIVRTSDLVGITGGSSGTYLVGSSGGQSICNGFICSGTVHTLTIKNLDGNDDMFIGDSGCKPYSGHGYLIGGNETHTLDVCNPCNIYVVANISGQQISWIGTDY